MDGCIDASSGTALASYSGEAKILHSERRFNLSGKHSAHPGSTGGYVVNGVIRDVPGIDRPPI